MNIYVSNLSFNVQDDDLRSYFEPYGEVSSAKIIMDKATGRSRGFGFVEMPDTEAANAAITALNEGTVDGRQIRVTEARPKNDEPRGGGGYSGGGGNRRGGGGGFNRSRW